VKAKVSIIIPCYNSGKHISDTINSVINQTYKNLEIIIIDDGSTDNSVEIINSINDERIILLRQENKGASCARNLGITSSKGDFIQFLDSDDLISHNKIELQVSAINNHKECIAVCHTKHFYNGEDYKAAVVNDYEAKFLFSTNDPINFLLNLWGDNKEKKGSMVQTNAWLIPISLINKAGLWSEHYSPDDDGEFFTRIICNSKQIIFTDYCYNYYRKFRSNQSLSSLNSEKAIRGVYTSIQLKEQYLSKYLDQETLQHVIGLQLENIILVSYLNNKKIHKEILQKYPHKRSFNYKLPLGGKAINLINKLFGWQIALKIQKIKHSII
jgi:glycosyltransferase involved in cell wall biosynthesis